MKRLFILSFVALNYAVSLFAYNIRQISNDEGLSNSAVLSVFQDRSGLMWFGTCDGLNMFDGSDVHIYKSLDNDNNLSGNMIEDIIETEKGVFWLQTNYGINRIDIESKYVNYYSYFIGKIFLRKDKNNTLLILKDNNVLYYYHSSSNQIKKIPLADFNFSNLLTCLVDNDNILRLLFRDGTIKAYSIEQTSEGMIILQKEPNFQLSNSILYAFSNNNAFYYVDNKYNFFEFDTKSAKNNYISPLEDVLASRGEISSIVRYKDDYFIGFKTNGVIRLKNIPEHKEKYVVEDIPINSGVFCIYKDHNQDIVWIGTDGQGVFSLYESPYVMKSFILKNSPHKIEKPVRSLHIDKENTLWIGTKGDGILKVYDFDYTDFSNKKQQHTTIENSGLSNNSVYAFSSSSKNVLWIGHENGLDYFSYKDRKIKKIQLNYNGKPLKYIHSICELNDSTLWLASVGMGIIGATITGLNNEPTLTNIKQITLGEGKESFNHFFTNFKESEDVVLYGNRGYGLCRINTKTLELSSTLFGNNASNQLLNDVFSIFKDAEENIWCGTSYGLVRYTPKDGKILVFNEQNGFPNNTIHGILEDSKNNLWLSTNQGIVRFDTETETIQAYNMQTGLKVTEFSDGAYYKDMKTGNLLFGGISGFISVVEKNYAPHEYTPSITFNNLSIFGVEYNLRDFCVSKGGQTILELKHNQNFFSISFSANDYIDGSNYNYFYQLGGQNEQWIDNGNRKNISFTNIAPQKYILSVKYINRVTGYESDVCQIILNIQPPWYKSILAYVLYVMLVLVLMGLTVFFLIRRNRKKRLKALTKIRQRHQVEVHESKLRFFTNIAHEFCTPLTLIYGPCNRILSQTSDSFVKENAQVIQRNAERLNGLIQELIEFRRIETENRKPQIEEVSITELSHDIIESFSEIIESKGFCFEYQIQPNLLWNTDKSFLYTVITNLLSNALKYTNYLGTIRMGVKSKKDSLEIVINNTGKGIRKEDHKRIFDRYSILDNFENKEDNSVSRNGLGLAISYNLVKLLNGEIAIESELDKETSFIIRIPQNELSKQIENTSEIPEAMLLQMSSSTILELPQYPIDLKKQTIFVIDDDMEILWLICEVFKDQYNVVPFSTINSVEELLSNTYPNIIISDVMMPGMDGISIVKQIKNNKITNHIPLILISAKLDIEEQIKGLDAGAEMYITKPFNIDFLKVSVSRLLDRKESLKDYYASALSAFDLMRGKQIHKEDKEFLEKVLNVINENLLEKDLSTKLIAQKLNFSSRHLYRKISDLGENSLADMIKESKLHVAENLLLNTKMSIDEISHNSGFSNRATFYNVFSAKFNCTPKEYRERKHSKVDS